MTSVYLQAISAEVRARSAAARARRGLVIAVASALGACHSAEVADAGLAQTNDATHVLLADNPWAARQRRPNGRRIQTVEYFEGQVYVGFGDWRANTGPIAVTSWDLANQEWLFHFYAETEAIERYRALPSGLFLPYTDPSARSDYAQGPDWREVRAAVGLREAFFHVFDAAYTDAGTFLIGTRRNIGEAQVRRWDGARWEDSLVLEGGADWLWFGAVLDGELVVQSEKQGTFRFDGQTWRQAEPLFDHPRVRAVVSLAGRAAGITRTPGPGYLQTSDGHGRFLDSEADAWDLNLDQETGWAYLLRSDRIERSRDLLSWEILPIAVPPGASAIDVAGDRAWIGTVDSRLWQLDLAGAH